MKLECCSCHYHFKIKEIYKQNSLKDLHLYPRMRNRSLEALTNVSNEDALLYTAAPARLFVLVLLEIMFFPHRRTSLK